VRRRLGVRFAQVPGPAAFRNRGGDAMPSSSTSTDRIHGLTRAPEPHRMEKTEVIQAFIDGRGLETYLEIGVRTGHTFLRIRARRKIAVDPAPRIGALKRLRWRFRNGSNRRSRIHRLTSDQLFARHGDLFAESGLGVAFVDGLHTYEQSLRDVENCLAHLEPEGVVLMHDCSPPSAAAAIPAHSPDEARRAAGDGWEGMWCGDVYKTILHLRSQRPDLRVCVLDCDRGIGIVERRTAERTLDLRVEEIAELGYADLAAHRAEWLGLEPPESLPDLVRPRS